jgi:hypothetical protein
LIPRDCLSMSATVLAGFIVISFLAFLMLILYDELALEDYNARFQLSRVEEEYEIDSEETFTVKANLLGIKFDKLNEEYHEITLMRINEIELGIDELFTNPKPLNASIPSWYNRTSFAFGVLADDFKQSIIYLNKLYELLEFSENFQPSEEILEDVLVNEIRKSSRLTILCDLLDTSLRVLKYKTEPTVLENLQFSIMEYSIEHKLYNILPDPPRMLRNDEEEIRLIAKRWRILALFMPRNIQMQLRENLFVFLSPEEQIFSF